MSRSIKNQGADRPFTQEESLSTPDLKGESELYNEIKSLYAKRYTALQGERMDAVKAAAKRAYKTLMVVENGRPENRTDARQEAAESKMVLRFASSFFTTTCLPSLNVLASTKGGKPLHTSCAN